MPEPRQPLIHVVMIAFENPAQTLVRWRRDVRPAVRLYTVNSVVTAVDNSVRPSQELHDEFGSGYLWQNGKNLLYGPSLNLAVPRHPTADYVLYVCTKHGKAHDLTWVGDLINPMERDGGIAMTGHLMGSNSPSGVSHDGGSGCEWVKDAFRFDGPNPHHDDVKEHVQGGVFAARAHVMLRFPYQPQFPHNYTDHLLTWSVLKAGWRVQDVGTIKSVWRDTIPDIRGLKYTHSEDHV